MMMGELPVIGAIEEIRTVVTCKIKHFNDIFTSTA